MGELKETEDDQESSDPLERPERRETQDHKDQSELTDHKDPEENKDQSEPKANQELQESKDHQDVKETEVLPEVRVTPEKLEPLDFQESQDLLDDQERSLDFPTLSPTSSDLSPRDHSPPEDTTPTTDTTEPKRPTNKSKPTSDTRASRTTPKTWRNSSRRSTRRPNQPVNWNTQPEPALNCSTHGNSFHPTTTSSTPTRVHQLMPSSPNVTKRPRKLACKPPTPSRLQRPTTETERRSLMLTNGLLEILTLEPRSHTRCMFHR